MSKSAGSHQLHSGADGVHATASDYFTRHHVPDRPAQRLNAVIGHFANNVPFGDNAGDLLVGVDNDQSANITRRQQTDHRRNICGRLNRSDVVAFAVKYGVDAHKSSADHGPLARKMFYENRPRLTLRSLVKK